MLPVIYASRGSKIGFIPFSPSQHDQSVAGAFIFPAVPVQAGGIKFDVFSFNQDLNPLVSRKQRVTVQR